VCVCVCVIGL